MPNTLRKRPEVYRSPMNGLYPRRFRQGLDTATNLVKMLEYVEGDISTNGRTITFDFKRTYDKVPIVAGLYLDVNGVTRRLSSNSAEYSTMTTKQFVITLSSFYASAKRARIKVYNIDLVE